MTTAMLLDTSKFEQQYQNACNAMHELDQIIVATGQPLNEADQAKYNNLKTDADRAKQILEHFRAQNARVQGQNLGQNPAQGGSQGGQGFSQGSSQGGGQGLGAGQAQIMNNQVPGEQKHRFGKQKEGFEDDPKVGFRNAEEYFGAVVNYGKMVHEGNAGAVTDQRIKYLSSTRNAEQFGLHNLQTDGGDVAVTGDLTGSVFVPMEFSPEIFKTDAQIPSGAFKTNRRTSRSMTVTKRYRLDKDHRESVTGGFQVGRNFEMLCNRSSAAEYAQYTVTMHALYGAYVASDLMLEHNAAMIAQEVEEGFRTEFESNRIIEILTGNAAGEYRGIWNSNALIKVAPKSGPSSPLTVGSLNLQKEDIYRMNERLWRGGNRESLVWIAGLKYMLPLKMLQDTSTSTNTHFLFDPNGGPDWADGTLDGIPIVFTEYVPPLGYFGGLGLYNMAEYEEYSWRPMRMASSMHAKFICNQTVMKFWTYTGGRPRWDSTLIPKAIAKDADPTFIEQNTLSPFVVWDGDDANAPVVNRPHSKGRTAAAA